MKKHAITQWKILVVILSVLVMLCAHTGRALAFELRVRNDFDKKMFVSVVYLDASPQKWRTRGWYTVQPRSERKLFFSTTKQTVYLFAELSDSKMTWGKGDITRTVITEAFSYFDGEECPNGNNRRSVEFTKYETRNDVIVYRPVSSAFNAPLKDAGESIAMANTLADKAPTIENNAVELLKLINAERKKVGAAELQFDNDMQKAAAQRASEVTRKYSHSRPDGRSYSSVFEELGLSLFASAENIAWRSGNNNISMADFNNAFMNSPGHRDNMLNGNYEIIGIGITRNGDKLYVVELFARK